MENIDLLIVLIIMVGLSLYVPVLAYKDIKE